MYVNSYIDSCYSYTFQAFWRLYRKFYDQGGNRQQISFAYELEQPCASYLRVILTDPFGYVLYNQTITSPTSGVHTFDVMPYVSGNYRITFEIPKPYGGLRPRPTDDPPCSFYIDNFTVTSYSNCVNPEAGYAANRSSYRFGFNGQEKDDEVYGDANAYDFGARIYDPRLGRWFSTDAKTREFPYYSAYLFAANSPIIGIDNGDELIVTGSAEAISKFETLLKNELGSDFTVKISKGVVTITPNNDQAVGNLSQERQNFYTDLSKITDINSPKVEVGIVDHNDDASKNVIVGSYEKEMIDIDDINKFSDNGLSTKRGALIHEIVEQNEKQNGDSKVYGKDHRAAIKAENRANGSERKDVSGFSFGNKRPYNGQAVFEYSKSTVKDGKEEIETQTNKVNYSDGQIIKIEYETTIVK